MREALHLDGAEHAVAVLCDGPALRLRRAGIADVFAPLPRLARVVAHGPRVQWRTEALLACAEAGVPVMLLDGRGGLRAVLLPAAPPAQRRDLAAVLEAAATQPGFRGRLEDFCHAELRRAVLRTLQAMRPLPVAADMRLGALLRHWLGPREEATAAWAAWALLRGVGAAAVAEGLVRLGVGPNFLARRSGCFPLPELLGEALVTPLCPALPALSAPAVPETEMRRRVIRLFEGSRPSEPRDQMLARLAFRFGGEV